MGNKMGNKMKIKLSKKQWQEAGIRAGWIKKSQMIPDDGFADGGNPYPDDEMDIMNAKIKMGDKVKLVDDVLPQHSRSVPAYMGYTTEQFRWRDTLKKLKGQVGFVERVFPNSDHVNVQFGETLIGIESSMLEKVNENSFTPEMTSIMDEEGTEGLQ